MGRGGAFVAGADDLGAVWYNPAGIADAGSAILIDGTWLRFSLDYTREMLVIDADKTYRRVRSPTVSGSTPILPLPTIVGSYAFGKKKEWTIAGGVLAPYMLLASYPVVVDGQPSPARYTLGSFNGSAIAMPGAWISYKPIEQVRVGLGVLALVGYFQSTVSFSASPQDRLIGAPEQPEFDADAQMRVGPIIAPSVTGGVTVVPFKSVRIGVSGNLPMVISAPANFTVRMPSDVVFDTSRQNGTNAHVRFVLPAVFRVGIEVRPIEKLRIEAAYVREFWEAHRTIDATPQGMTIDGITGLPPQVKIPPIQIPRSFESSNSFRLGAEVRLAVGKYPVDLRFGGLYEKSAIPPAYLSLSSLDFDKVILSVGGSIHLGAWRLDALFSQMFLSSVYVDPRDAKIGRINPINGNAPFESVNGGNYSANANLIGFGMNYRY
jgi:long-chain fatty acid transport protein